MKNYDKSAFAIGVGFIGWVIFATYLFLSENMEEKASGVVMILIAVGALAKLTLSGEPEKTGKLYHVSLHTLPADGARLVEELRPYTADSSIENSADGKLSFLVDKADASDIMWMLEEEPVYSVHFTRLPWGDEE